jgi:hypothetical protein
MLEDVSWIFMHNYRGGGLFSSFMKRFFVESGISNWVEIRRPVEFKKTLGFYMSIEEPEIRPLSIESNLVQALFIIFYHLIAVSCVVFSGENFISLVKGWTAKAFGNRDSVKFKFWWSFRNYVQPKIPSIVVSEVGEVLK